MTTHSPLGASGTYRWMNCTGSVALTAALSVTDDDGAIEPSYRVEGSAAHELVSLCLMTGTELWEHADKEFCGVPVSKLDLPAIQTYITLCRTLDDEAKQKWIEHGIGEKMVDRPHPYFFGTVDYAVLYADRLALADFKYGAGVVVDAEENPQVMYYAWGLILELPDLPDDFRVDIYICQPRAYGESPIKHWATTAGFIREWGRDVLIPAMKRAAKQLEPDADGGTFAAGEHCRFCPAKLACPLLQGMFAVAAKGNTAFLKGAPAPSLFQEWRQIAAVKKYIKAVEDETMARLLAGADGGDAVKLVNKKANRVWKPEALEKLTEALGDQIWNEREMKSPPEVEDLGQSAALLVKEYAYTPQTGYTVAPAESKLPKVKVENAASTFAHFAAASTGENP